MAVALKCAIWASRASRSALDDGELGVLRPPASSCTRLHRSRSSSLVSPASWVSFAISRERPVGQLLAALAEHGLVGLGDGSVEVDAEPLGPVLGAELREHRLDPVFSVRPRKLGPRRRTVQSGLPATLRMMSATSLRSRRLPAVVLKDAPSRYSRSRSLSDAPSNRTLRMNAGKSGQPSL